MGKGLATCDVMGFEPSLSQKSRERHFSSTGISRSRPAEAESRGLTGGQSSTPTCWPTGGWAEAEVKGDLALGAPEKEMPHSGESAPLGH